MRQKATGTLTVGNIARVAAVRYGDREAIFCSATGRRFTFREVNRRTNRLANVLSASPPPCWTQKARLLLCSYLGGDLKKTGNSP